MPWEERSGVGVSWCEVEEWMPEIILYCNLLPTSRPEGKEGENNVVLFHRATPIHG